MKRILFALLALVLLVSCGKDSYKIKGEIQGVEDGCVMVLSTLEYDGLNTLDSTVVKGGKFTFKGETDTAQVAVITFEIEDQMRGCQRSRCKVEPADDTDSLAIEFFGIW